MLLRFSVENFGCFRDEATLSMVASVDGRHPDHMLNPGKSNRPAALKAAGIYGANGHGKSQFVDAVVFLKNLVADGTSGAAPLPVNPFRLRRNSLREPSRFVVNFRTGGVEYEYGIVVRAEGIDEEWLFERRESKEQLVFQRITSIVDGKVENKIEFGSRIKREKLSDEKIDSKKFLSFIAFGTRRNQPFLTEAVERNVTYLEDVHQWFSETLQVARADSSYTALHHRAREQEDFLKLLTEFVAEADTGIADLIVEETPLDSDLLGEMPEGARERFKADLSTRLNEDNMAVIATPDGTAVVIEKTNSGDLIACRLMARRASEEGEFVTFPIEDESSGTRRLLDLVPMLSHARVSERVYVVDELDRKLHPLLAYKFIESLLACSKGQIIFTTHNTLLLDLDLLRRDEIWFVQKATSGASDLYSLADFKIRPDLDVRKGYLHGRFGAIPFLGNLDDLGWCEPIEQVQPTVD